MKRINVTKTFLPPVEDYKEYVDMIWKNGQLTNQGPLLREFEKKTKQHLGVDNFHFVSNGTTALQLALRALDITEGEIITTPFSYVATTSAIMLERCKPVFVDIEPSTFCVDADKIEAAITDKTKAIIAVHVFGHPCDVEKIEAIAKKYKLKTIYDGAHSYGVTYKGKSLLSYGDISICSFHATKLFHTIEGGCLIAKDKKVSEKIELLKRFGHNGDDHYILGMNGKATEFQAAMGLCNLKYVDGLIEERMKLSSLYDQLLEENKKYTPSKEDKTKYNYGYYPIVLKSAQHLKKVMDGLAKKNIFPRRYFYPSLNSLPYVKTKQPCPISEDISKRILCLPLYAGLEEGNIVKICKIIKTYND